MVEWEEAGKCKHYILLFDQFNRILIHQISVQMRKLQNQCQVDLFF